MELDLKYSKKKLTQEEVENNFENIEDISDDELLWLVKSIEYACRCWHKNDR